VEVDELSGNDWISLLNYHLQVQCYIVRKKKGLFKAFPIYKLYLQQVRTPSIPAVYP
jgi:hypothetical protein